MRYGAVGAAGTFTHYVVLVSLVELLAAGAVLASSAGAFAGMLVNYFLNRRFTFASTKPHRVALLRFATVAVVGICLNAALMSIATRRFGLHYLVGQVIATFVVYLVTYAANRAWTF